MAAGDEGTNIFSESGWIAEVEILEDTSDAEYARYKLKVIKTERHPPRFEAPPDGTVFSVCQMKNAGAWAGMWRLTHRRATYDSPSQLLWYRLTGFTRRFLKESKT